MAVSRPLIERKKMGPGFDASEIFKIAEQIERNAAAFYRSAAGMFKDVKLSKVFTDLVIWETKHQELFAAMRTQLAQQASNAGQSHPRDPGLDPKAMAGLAVFGIRPDLADKLTGKESRRQVLKMAVEREKDSIVYYTGLKDFVPAATDRDKVEQIIKEEMRHIRILGESLSESQ